MSIQHSFRDGDKLHIHLTADQAGRSAGEVFTAFGIGNHDSGPGRSSLFQVEVDKKHFDLNMNMCDVWNATIAGHPFDPEWYKRSNHAAPQKVPTALEQVEAAVSEDSMLFPGMFSGTRLHGLTVGTIVAAQQEAQREAAACRQRAEFLDDLDTRIMEAATSVFAKPAEES